MSTQLGLISGSFRNSRLTRLMLSALAAAVLALGMAPANAEISIRVAEPVSDPVTIRATVAWEDGTPVTGLTVDDFRVQVNGNPVPLSADNFSLPAAEDPNQRVSVVFVMDYSRSVTDVALTPLQLAIENFINAMHLGDHAAIVKFAGNDDVSIAQPFTEITGDTGRSALISALYTPFPDQATALYAGLKLGLEQFDSSSTALPPGPKAIILASDGMENDSVGIFGRNVVEYANDFGVAIFSIGLGPLDDIVGGDATGRDVMVQLALQTGGQYAETPSDAEIAEVYEAVSNLLNNEYLLTFEYGIAGCEKYQIEVSVNGYGSQKVNASSRCSALPAANSSGGGGGALGPLGLIAGLSLLALRRRFWSACPITSNQRELGKSSRTAP